jgi:hypothetical protein
MNQTYKPPPTLLELKWAKAKDRGNDKEYGTAEYAYKNDFVYKRVPDAASPRGYLFYRVHYAVASKKSCWWNIEDSDWSPVNQFGTPISRTG